MNFSNIVMVDLPVGHSNCDVLGVWRDRVKMQKWCVRFYVLLSIAFYLVTSASWACTVAVPIYVLFDPNKPLLQKQLAESLLQGLARHKSFVVRLTKPIDNDACTRRANIRGQAAGRLLQAAVTLAVDPADDLLQGTSFSSMIACGFGEQGKQYGLVLVLRCRAY